MHAGQGQSNEAVETAFADRRQQAAVRV